MKIDPDSPVEVMALFEALWRLADKRPPDALKTVSVRFPLEEWSFDPRSAGDLCRRHPPLSPGLTIRTTPRLLHRLLTEPDFYLGKDESLIFGGDVEQLRLLSEHLGVSNVKASL
jgi:hypothetical protein